eukprot:jgi/Tetstr1/434112/TSEL_023256.t1
MAGGKKAADPTKATPADSLAETPAEPTETTRDTTTLALLQAMALKVDALSTRLDEQDNNKHKEQRDIPSDDDEVGEGGKEPEHDARTAAAAGGARDAAAVFIDPRDWEDLLPWAYQDCPPPPPSSGATRPSLWRPRNDEADRYFTEANKTASRDEYRHLLCYGVYRAAANAAAKTALATLRAPDTLTQDRVDALDLLDAAHRTLEAVGDAEEARLTYLRRFKAKKALTPEEQVAERLIYSRVFDTAEHERCANVVDGLLAALEDKRLEVGLAAAAKAHASATFKRQAAERDTDSNKAQKEKDKAARERREQQRREADAKNRDKNGGKDQRHDTFNQGVSFNDATPAQLKFLTAELRRFTAAGAWEKSSCAWWVSRAFFVPKPGDKQWRFIIDLHVLNTFCARKRLRMETLMGVRHLTTKGDYMLSFDLQDGFYALGIAPSDRDYFTVNIRGTLYRLGGGERASYLPYVDDFLLFASSEPEALELRQRFANLLDSLGLQRNPAKGLWEPVQYGQHLGVDIDTATGYVYAPVEKLQRLVRQAKQLLQRAARDARWLPGRELQSLAGRAKYLFLAITAARFYLRELHDVVGSKWGGRAGGAGVLGAADERQHITWKELKAVRLAVESFLPHLAGRRVLLREDNQAVCSVLAGLTSRSPAMMAELRKLWYLLDNNGVHIRARYIRHERDATTYTAAWLDPGCEAVDSLHLSDAEWRRENDYCNPP